MLVRRWKPVLLAAVTCAALVSPATTAGLNAQPGSPPRTPARWGGQAVPRSDNGLRVGQNRNTYDRGYRDGYDRVRGASYRQSGRTTRPGVFGRQLPRRYQEPAFARGYANGYERGLNDGRRHDRYDPVGSRDYRNGDRGYYGSYGSRDAYKNNYRAGFRQGYEDGYRDAR